MAGAPADAEVAIGSARVIVHSRRYAAEFKEGKSEERKEDSIELSGLERLKRENTSSIR